MPPRVCVPTGFPMKEIENMHEFKARTAHDASAMCVQHLVNSKRRPGNKQKALSCIWSAIRVLVIEEVSMTSAAVYNMLDIRAAHGRSATHDVSEMT